MTIINLKDKRDKALREKVETMCDCLGIDRKTIDDPFVTNFDEKDRVFYEQAIKKHGDASLKIEEPNPPCFTGGALYHHEFGDLGKFWDVFDNIKTGSKNIDDELDKINESIEATVHNLEQSRQEFLNEE